MHATTVRFGDDTYAALRAIADREGMPISHLIREAVVIRLATGIRPAETAVLRRDLDALASRMRRAERALGLPQPSRPDPLGREPAP